MQVADGGLEQLGGMLRRLKELAIQSAGLSSRLARARRLAMYACVAFSVGSACDLAKQHLFQTLVAAWLFVFKHWLPPGLCFKQWEQDIMGTRTACGFLGARSSS